MDRSVTSRLLHWSTPAWVERSVVNVALFGRPWLIINFSIRWRSMGVLRHFSDGAWRDQGHPALRLLRCAGRCVDKEDKWRAANISVPEKVVVWTSWLLVSGATKEQTQ